MKNPIICVATFISLQLAAPLQAQKTPEALPETRDEFIEALMETRDAKHYAEIEKAARKAGLPEQILVEARFLFLVDNGTRSELAAFAPKLKAQLPKFSLNDTVIFAVKEDFESVIEYTQALAALERKDFDQFKKHITEAFWLSPVQGARYAPLIDEVRMERLMKNIRLDLERKFPDQKSPKTGISFKKIIGEAPAALLHFWSPWVEQSLASLPDFSATAEILKKHNIPSASILLAGTEDSRADGDTWLKTAGAEFPGVWLVDHEKDSLASKLRVQSFPAFVLINREGKILFNGDPAAPSFWNALSKIDPNILETVKNPVLQSEKIPEEPNDAEKKEGN